jgi:hypothetical protein
MASTYVNDLRLNEMATGDASGTWGTTTNTNLELIGEALGYGTEAITTNADTHTSTVADGATDPARSMYIKYTGTLDSTCTITIAPNTLSRVHIIENATSGSQSIIISQGSGANVTIGTGAVKIVYLDGAGSGAAVTDALVDLDLTGTTTAAALTLSGNADFNGDLDVDGTTNLDVVDIDGAVDMASTLAVAGTLSSAGGLVHQGDTNTSLDFGTDQQTFYVGGVRALDLTTSAVVFNEGSADVDFRVESNGSTYALFVDGGNNHVNIMTSTDLGAVLNVSGNAYIQHADNTDTLTLESTDADSNVGPNLRLYRNSGSPADGDVLSLIKFEGRNDNSQDVVYSTLDSRLVDASDGTEDGSLELTTIVAGSQVSRVFMGATETVINDNSVDVDFRVESNDNTHMLFVDAANNGVAIGHNNPQDILHISTTNAASHIRVQRHESDEALGDGDEIGAVEFWANDSTSFSGASTLRAAIRAEVQNTSLGTRLEFYTGNSSAAVSERMRIIADGKIGINQTEPSRQLHITDTIANSGASLGLTSSDSSTTGSMGIVHFGNSTDSSLASIGAIADGATDSGVLLFKTEATGGAIEERMRINSVGSVGIGVADGDVTSDGTASRTYVGIIGTANRGRLNIGSTASNGADAGMLAFTNGSNVLGSIVVDTAAGAQTIGTMYVTSTGNLDIRAAANYGVIINEGSVDADFRVESNGNANMLVVDGGDDSVRVGGASGESGDTFSVVESGANVVNSRFRNANADANGVRVVFEKASASPANNDEIAQLDFMGRDSAGNAELYAGIQCFIDDVTSSTEDGILRFGTITNATYRNRLDILPTETVFNQDGVSINFRVETDNSSNTLFVDGGNDRVYVGDNQGSDLFYITGKADSTAMGIKIGTNGYNAIEFDNATGSLVGRITTSSASTAYVTSSDYRLKENVADMTGATARLKQLKPKRFNWISDDTNTPLDGFLAHEVSSVVPEAVAGEKDAVHPDGHHEAGQIDPQGIDHSKLVPLLVKTIQELEARITTLEG